MYKTVRKGDASLQYTILPQTDVPSNSISNDTSESPKMVQMTKYSVVIIMLIFVTSLSTGALINQTYFANTFLALPKKIIQTSITGIHNKINVTHVIKEKLKETKEQIAKPTVKFMIETLTRRNEEVTTLTTPLISEGKENSKVTEVFTETSSPLRNILRIPSSLPKQISPSTESPMALKTGSPLTTLLASTIAPKESEMPRITLKLRKNETVSQMYMKSVIASNEKGNITTSVLAHGLSLEGLIFKTPDGTIRPWNRQANRRITEVIISIHFKLILLGFIILVVMWILFYVQRRVMRRQRQNVEEFEGDKLEGDDSTLLKDEADENE